MIALSGMAVVLHSSGVMKDALDTPVRNGLDFGTASTSKGVGLAIYGQSLPWLSVTALSFTGGGVDAIGLSTVQHYATHMSGTTSQLAGAIVGLDLSLMALLITVTLAFLLGAIGSGWIIAGAETGEPRQVASRALFVEALLIACGTVALLYPHGDVVGAAVALFPLAAAMGLQNRTGVFLAGGKARTTHVTGTLTDLGYHVGRLIRDREAARVAKDKASVGRLSALFCGFLMGGIIGRLAFLRVGIAAPLMFSALPLVVGIAVRVVPATKLSVEE